MTLGRLLFRTTLYTCVCVQRVSIVQQKAHEKGDFGLLSRCK